MNFDLGAVPGQNDELTFGNASPSGTLNFAFDNPGSNLANGQYDLVHSTGGGLTGSGYTLNNTTPTLLGHTLTLSSSGNDIYLNVSGGGQAAIGSITATPSSAAIITGGSTPFTFTVANSGSSNLNFSVTAGNNTTGSVSGPVLVNSGSTSSTTSGSSFSGTAVGPGQTGSFSISDTASSNSPQTGTVTVNVYGHASPSAIGTTIGLPSVHVGYAGSLAGTSSASVSNASGYRVNLMTLGATTSGNLSINNVSNIASGNSAAIGATLANGQSAGEINQNFTLAYADNSGLPGSSNNLGSLTITVTGEIYSGQGAWNTSGSGSWNKPANWTADGGVPGIDGPTLSASDSATFGAAATLGPLAIVLDNTSPQVSAVTFSSTNSYALLQGSGTGVLTLSATRSGLALVRVSTGSHSIGAPLMLANNVEIDPVAGTQLTIFGNISQTVARSLTLNGAGRLVLSGTDNYSGGTNVEAGKLVLASNTAFPDGTSLTVGAGGTLIFTPWRSRPSRARPLGTGPRAAWKAATNWTDGGGLRGVPGVSPRPDDLDTATFSGSGSVTTIVLDVNPSLKALSFSGSNYALSSGSLTLHSNTGTATVTVSSGTQSIASMVTLSSSLSIAPAAGSQLTISGNVGEASPRQALSLTGAGRLILSGTDSYSGGTNVEAGKLVLASNTAFPDGTSLTVGAGGTLIFTPLAVATFSGSATWDGTTSRLESRNKLDRRRRYAWRPRGLAVAR